MQTIPLTFEAVHEPEPGLKWQRQFEARWPAYRRWFLHEGEAARASYATSRRMLRRHMPEIVPVWERLVELAGGGDLAARMLSMWHPPSYLSGCTQGVFTAGEPTLVRNYDYAPERLEGVVLHTEWQGRRVIGMSDCCWGLVDGINDAGLAVSLAFGGRAVIGEGFGIPLIVRYLLQSCESVGEARQVLARLPYQLAHNLTLVDRGGDVVTAYVAPDRQPYFHGSAAAANHQGAVEWNEHARFTRSVEREERIVSLLADPATTSEAFADAFLDEPLYSSSYAKGFGTLYTAVYRPVRGEAEYRWPGSQWSHSFDRFAEGEHTAHLPEVEAVA